MLRSGFEPWPQFGRRRTKPRWSIAAANEWKNTFLQHRPHAEEEEEAAEKVRKSEINQSWSPHVFNIRRGIFLEEKDKFWMLRGCEPPGLRCRPKDLILLENSNILVIRWPLDHVVLHCKDCKGNGLVVTGDQCDKIRRFIGLWASF